MPRVKSSAALRCCGLTVSDVTPAANFGSVAIVSPTERGYIGA